MPGLSLGVGGNVTARAQPRSGSVSAPATASEAAWGPGNTTTPATGSLLLPNHPAGIQFWLSAGAMAALVLLYYSLPK